MSVKKRKAEFINPPNILKLKVGTGGLTAAVIEKAQKIIDSQTGEEFVSIAMRQLAAFQEGIRLCETQASQHDPEILFATLIHPAMQLKANGAMFNYPLVTSISARLISVLELAENINADMVELMDGYHTVLRAILGSQLRADGGKVGQDLVQALETATLRYLEKYSLRL